MNIEYEVRVLEISVEDVINKIEMLGGVKEGTYMQKRYVYDFNPKQPNKWIRLRTNGPDTTLTIKEVMNSKIDGTKELEVKVSDFNTMNTILNQLGYIPKGFQENKRTRYHIGEVELDIDTWPNIPTYLEIEGKNEEEVTQILNKLNLKNNKITSLDVQSIYMDIYGIDIEKNPNLGFNE